MSHLGAESWLLLGDQEPIQEGAVDPGDVVVADAPEAGEHLEIDLGVPEGHVGGLQSRVPVPEGPGTWESYQGNIRVRLIEAEELWGFLVGLDGRTAGLVDEVLVDAEVMSQPFWCHLQLGLRILYSVVSSTYPFGESCLAPWAKRAFKEGRHRQRLVSWEITKVLKPIGGWNLSVFGDYLLCPIISF